MTLLHRLASMLRWIVRRAEAEQDLDDELRAFVEIAAADEVRDGLSAAEAHRMAVLALGGVEQTKERVRDGRPGAWLDDVGRDVRYALRTCQRNPSFTAVIVITLALGIGANAAVFSLVDTLMLRSLPVRHPEQLVEPLFKYSRDPWLNLYRWSDYERLRHDNHVFSDLIAISPKQFQLTDSTHGAEIVDGAFVSDNFFDALGLQPAMGRLIDSPEGRSGSAGSVSVISWPFWKTRFNLDPSVLGQSLVVNDVPTTIVGITPRGFFGLQLGMDPSVWLPAALDPAIQKPSHLGANWRSQDFSLVGRLKPGVTIEQAKAEMRVLDRARLADLEAQTHDVQWRDVPLQVAPAGAGLSVLRERFGSSLQLMMVAVSVLLLLACLNVASILLARGAARHREMAVRVALGAGRFRLLRQVLTESLLLSTCGGVCGLVVAYVGAHALVTFIASGRSPVGMPQPLQIPVQVDVRLLLLAAAVTVLAGLAFGLVLAWRAFMSAPSSSLREIDGAGETRRWRRFGQALVVTQVALSMVLLTAAVLFVRYLVDLRSVGLGFQADSVLQFRLDWTRSGYTPAARKRLLWASHARASGSSPEAPTKTNSLTATISECLPIAPASFRRADLHLELHLSRVAARTV